MAKRKGKQGSGEANCEHCWADWALCLCRRGVPFQDLTRVVARCGMGIHYSIPLFSADDQVFPLVQPNSAE